MTPAVPRIWNTRRNIRRFWSKVLVRGPKDCWNWTAHVMTPENPYGQYRPYPERLMYAHTYSKMLEIGGEIPKGLWVLHKCDNPRCVNPKHLFLGTQKDNMKDMVRKGRNPLGSKRPGAKLREEWIPKIRRMRRKRISCQKIADKFDVSPSLIYMVGIGKIWRHV